MEDIEMKDETISLNENEDHEPNKSSKEKSNHDLKIEYKWPHQKKINRGGTIPKFLSECEEKKIKGGGLL